MEIADEEIKWKTRDGKRVHLGDMNPEHLRNAARFLRDAADAEDSGYWAAGSMLHGEAALDDWEWQARAVSERCQHRYEVADAMDRVRKRKEAALVFPDLSPALPD